MQKFSLALEREKVMQEIPVYLVSGFMDSGKTTLIEDTLYNQGFAEEGRTLLICCEDGDVEYDKEALKKNFVTLVMIENEDDFNRNVLANLISGSIDLNKLRRP